MQYYLFWKESKLRRVKGYQLILQQDILAIGLPLHFEAPPPPGLFLHGLSFFLLT